MTDIVTRLHSYLASELDTSDDAARERDAMIAETADELERLRAKLAELEGKWRETQRMLR